MDLGNPVMRLAIALVCAASALAVAGAASAASVEVKDAVARVTVIPEDRADVKVEFLTSNPKLPLEVRTLGGLTVIDGGLRHRIHNCNHHGGHPTAAVWGVGEVEGDAIPQVVIRTPRAVNVSANGAVFGAVGRSASLDLQDSGCSSWTVADVTGDAAVRSSGAGSVQIGSTGRLNVRLSGAANIHAVRVRQGFDSQLSGAGNIQVEDVDGPVDARVSGMGHIRLANGHVTTLRASISGVGGVDFGGTADNLDAGVSGIGSVHVKQVTGTVTKSVSGAGHVTVDGRPS